eukprot:gene17679-21078_t
MAEFQGKLFVTVIQAQNLIIKQEKSSVAGQFVGALSTPLIQGIERIQSFSSTHVKKLAPIFTVPGSLIAQGISNISDAIKGDGAVASSSPGTMPAVEPPVGVTCVVELAGEEFRTGRAADILEPKWKNESHTFNVTNPAATVHMTVSLRDTMNGADFVIGRAVINLLDEVHLWGQKPIGKWINITKRGEDASAGYTDDEVVGSVELQLQYKYRNVWDCVYHGKMLHLEGKHTEALEQVAEALQVQPTNPKIYSLAVDCHMGLKQYVKAIENSLKIIQYDPTCYEGQLKTSRVLMAAGQLDRAQMSIDKARALDEKSEEIKNAQMELNHMMEVDRINKLMEQGYNDFASPVLYELRALCYVCARNNPAAIADTTKILEIDHTWPKTDLINSGTMMKDGQINVMSKRRWFSLKSIFLFYFKDHMEHDPQGVICLHDFGCAPKPGQKVKFQIKTKDREYYLKAESPEEFDKWVDLLTKMSRVRTKLPAIKECQSKVVWRNIYAAKQEKQSSFMLPDVMMLPETLFVESGRFAFSIGDKIKAKFQSIPQADTAVAGWLYKMGALNKGWQKRYFFIHSNTLYYAKLRDGEERATSLTPTGILPLEGARIDGHPAGIAKANAFGIITALRRNFILAADSPTDLERWLRAIAVASGQTPVVEERPVAEVMPTSDSLFANRSRKIKSLRAVPSATSPAVVEEEVVPKPTTPLRRIGSNEMSASESKYFSKLNIPTDNVVIPPPIITSKHSSTSYSQSPASNGGANGNGQAPSNNNHSRSMSNVLDINDDQDDNADPEVGLVSGQRKQDDEKRCCKCTIQ